MRKFLFALIVLISCSHSSDQSGPPSEPPPLESKGIWCRTYSPGQSLSYKQYDELVKKAGDYSRAYSKTGYDNYLSAVEREATGALYRVFSNLKSDDVSVWYGTFTPEEGFIGEDNNRGFRVITKTTLVDGAGRRFLVVVITFWTYRNGKLQLRGGPDSARVRIQIDPDSADLPRGSIMSVSYQVDIDGDGKVTGLRATRFYGEDGTTVPSGLSPAVPNSGNHGCFFCHSSGTQYRSTLPLKSWLDPTGSYDLRDDVIDQSLVTPELRQSVRQFVDSISTADRGALVESFKSPKTTFYPQGILEALSENCERIGKANN